MLLRALFVCVACTVVAQTMLQGVAALARATLHRTAVTAAAVALTDAGQRAQLAIAAAQMQGEQLSGPLPSPQPTCVLSTQGDCALVAQEAVVITTPSPTPCPSAGCATYLQENDAVAEGREQALLTARIVDVSGAAVATRNATLLFRTLRIAPYAIASGASDGALDDTESGAGDAGGIVPGSFSPGTLIDVVYKNATTGALMPANVWNGLSPGQFQASSWSP